MNGYKYPPRWPTAQRTQSLQPSSALRTELRGENRTFKMLRSRCVLPFLALYLLMEEISAAALPSRNRRELSWLDQELFPLLPDRSEQGDLSVGDAGEMDRGVDVRPSHSETNIASTEHLSLQHQNYNQNQFQYHPKPNEKRRKVARLDSIGSFQMSNFRKRNEEPGDAWEDNRE